MLHGLPLMNFQNTSFLRFHRFRIGNSMHLNLIVLCFIISFLSILRTRQQELSIGDQLRQARISAISPSPPFSYFVTACVIVQESSDILPEFIVRNYLAGVDHFFIYGDDDSLAEMNRLREIFAALPGIITYIPHGRTAPDDEEDPEQYVQMRMYRHCLRKFGNTSKWVALIDTDEFFESPSLAFMYTDTPLHKRRAFLHDVLTAYPMFPILCVRWKTALTNGRLLPPRRGETLENVFPRTCRVNVNNKEKLALRKPILQPIYLDFKRSPKLDVAIHKGFNFKGEKRKLNCVWGIGHDLEPPIHLVHYWSRDLSSYFRKIRRGRPRKGVPARSLSDLFWRESICIQDEKSNVKHVRSELLRTLIEKIPSFEPSRERLGTAEEVIGSGFNSTVFPFCTRHVSKLISELSKGNLFSDTAYCNNINSDACSLLHEGKGTSWPFPWAEYMQKCDESQKEDNYYQSE